MFLAEVALNEQVRYLRVQTWFSTLSAHLSHVYISCAQVQGWIDHSLVLTLWMLQVHCEAIICSLSWYWWGGRLRYESKQIHGPVTCCDWLVPHSHRRDTIATYQKPD